MIDIIYQMSNDNIIYRVYDKKGRYQQSYSPKLKDSRSWAIDCASILKGCVKEDTIDEKGFTEKSKKIFETENQSENSKNRL